MEEGKNKEMIDDFWSLDDIKGLYNIYYTGRSKIEEMILYKKWRDKQFSEGGALWKLVKYVSCYEEYPSMEIEDSLNKALEYCKIYAKDLNGRQESPEEEKVEVVEEELKLDEKKIKAIEPHVDMLQLSQSDREYLHHCLAQIADNNKQFAFYGRRLVTSLNATNIKEAMKSIYGELGRAGYFDRHIFAWMEQMLFEQLDNQNHESIYKSLT